MAAPLIDHTPRGVIKDAVRSTRRRAGALREAARTVPVAVASTLTSTPPAEMAQYLQDIFWPTDHVLAEPPPGSGLKGVPGNAGYPLVGSTPWLTGDRVREGAKQVQEYGTIMWTSMPGGRRSVVVADPDAVTQILLNSDKAYSNDGWQDYIGKFFDRGLMLLSFGEHLQHRRIMQSAFSPTRLSGYLAGMDRRITEDLARNWPTSGELLMYPRTKQLAIAVAADIFLGMELGGRDKRRILDSFYSQVRAATEPVRADIPGTLWGRGRNGFDTVQDVLRREIPRKRAGDGDDLFSAIVHARDEDGAAFTDKEIVDHMNFMWLAAHDTTTLAMTMMAWAFGAHPEWQDKARAEARAIGDRALTADDLKAMPTIELVMNEVMRMWPPVPVMMRKTVKDADLNGYHVPEGTLVSVLNSSTHYLPEYFKDPFTFDPSRFLPPREEHKQHKHAYYPFGAGAHKCIGFAFAQIETKALWHRLLLTREFRCEPGYQPQMGWKALPEPTDDLPVTVSPLA